MAISKSAKIQAEIEKVTSKINEQQARLKELEQKKLEAENSEIVEIVRGMSVSLTDLPALLQTIKSGGTLGQNVPKSEDNRTTAKIGNEAGDSYKTVQRLIRLTYLVPELQEYVDKGKMKMLPAYELSFLDEDAQRDIVDNIDETETFPSHAQARRMRKAFEEGNLDYDAVTEIMNEIKPNQVEKLKIPIDDIRKYVPKSMTPAEMQAYLLKLVKQDYERQHNHDAR